MAKWICVDVGGTFTDLIAVEPSTGETIVEKVPTTSAAPDEGVLNAIDRVAALADLQDADYFLHGTTVGLNALIERRGAKVGLLTTRGFRDVLEVRRADRAEPYNLFWKAQDPMVPRRLRIPITERILASGEVDTDIDLDEVEAAAEVFRSEGVSAVAIAFIHGYANASHEQAAADALRKAGFDGDLSLSSAVSGEYREYERTTTTVIDAFVRARMANYLDRLDSALRRRRFGGMSLVSRSGGGALTFAEAAGRPFETIVSGPVAGVEGAAELARILGCSEVIAADVGGTSFDVAVIVEGRPTTLYEGTVVGLPVQTPWVDVRSIGAGGGSVAYVDEGGLLRVGPRSAGAVPGPACYDRGGSEPTVTDAALLLGMLGPGELAGSVHLDRAAAEHAMAPLCDALEMSEEEVARGIVAIITANMAGAIREITVEQGRDPRAAALLPYGGAGPLFLSLLARELDISEVVLPPYAGNFSAWGLMSADLEQTVARTRVTELSPAGLEEINAILDELFLSASYRASTAVDGSIRLPGLDLRYVGQEHTLTVTFSEGSGRIENDPEFILDRFRSEYLTTFGLVMDEPVEIVAARATLRTPLPERKPLTMSQTENEQANGNGRASVLSWSFADEEWTEFELVHRADLRPGERIAGPAVLLEPTSTSYIDIGLEGQVHETGCIQLRVLGGTT